jgi:lipid-binding SYLF domain-containing protein
MSIKKLGVILFSSFLIFATAPLSSAQNTTNQDTTKKQTTSQKGTTTKDQSKQPDQSTTTDQSTSKTAKSKSQTTGKDKGTRSTTEKKTKKEKTTKKSSSVSQDKVRQAQTALMNQGFDPGPIDGIMGPLTMTALRNFQLHNHLQDTGTLTAETENMLLSGASAGTLSSDQRSSLETSGVTSQGNLSSMEDIQQVQQSLTDLGYAPGDINGMMSSDTRTAIREFQWMNSLPVTGNVDPSTKMAIDSQAQGSVANAYKQDTNATTRTKPSGQDTYGTDTKHHATGKYDKDAADRAAKAAAVLQDLTVSGDRRIPDAILQRAEAIAVIPHMIKGAFGIGGRYGKGLVSQRNASSSWSAPAFIEIGGGSFGAQLGVESTDLVLVFTDRKALDLLEKGKDLKLGVDASVAAGPIGRSAEAGTNANLATAVYAYSRAKGLFAGVALDGAMLNMDKSMNEKVYGPSVDAKEILSGNVAPNRGVQPFMDALERIAPKKHIS